MISPKFFPHRRANWAKVCAAAFFGALLATGGSASGQVYSTNFDSNAYQTPNSLSAQDGWDTNDQYNNQSSPLGGDAGQSDYVGTITYGVGGVPSPFSGNQGALGGIGRSSGTLPTSGTVYLEHPFSPGASTNYTFTTDFDISFPAAGTAGANFTRDSFAFTFGQNLQSTTAALRVPLFSLNFRPDTSAQGNSANQMIISYTAGTNAPVTPLVGGTPQAVAYNGVYHLVLAVSVTGTFTATITGSNSFSFTGTVGAANAAAVQEFAATWILANTATGNATTGYTNAGSNSLIMDNLSIVPEPSTWAMLGVGVLSLAVVARRRARA